MERVRPHCHEMTGWSSVPSRSAGAPSTPKVVTVTAAMAALGVREMSCRVQKQKPAQISSVSQIRPPGQPGSGRVALCRLAEARRRPPASTRIARTLVAPQSSTSAAGIPELICALYLRPADGCRTPWPGRGFIVCRRAGRNWRRRGNRPPPCPCRKNSRRSGGRSAPRRHCACRPGCAPEPPGRSGRRRCGRS